MARRKSTQLESIVKEIKRNTHRKFTAEEKIRIVLEGLKGEYSIADLCRKEGVHPTMYYKWSKDFLEAGKRRLNGDTIREANTEEVNDLRAENESLKQLVAELSLKNNVLKKTLKGLE
jgi:transposase